jgi:hypothetical protein
VAAPPDSKGKFRFCYRRHSDQCRGTARYPNLAGLVDRPAALALAHRFYLAAGELAQGEARTGTAGGVAKALFLTWLCFISAFAALEQDKIVGEAVQLSTGTLHNLEVTLDTWAALQDEAG